MFRLIYLIKYKYHHVKIIYSIARRKIVLSNDETFGIELFIVRPLYNVFLWRITLIYCHYCPIKTLELLLPFITSDDFLLPLKLCTS